MIAKMPLRGVSGVLHAWRYGDRSDCPCAPRRYADLNVLVPGSLRVVEIDGTFHVGRVFVEVSFSPNPNLHIVASFDNLDAAIMCFRLECGS